MHRWAIVTFLIAVAAAVGTAFMMSIQHQQQLDEAAAKNQQLERELARLSEMNRESAPAIPADQAALAKEKADLLARVAELESMLADTQEQLAQADAALAAQDGEAIGEDSTVFDSLADALADSESTDDAERREDWQARRQEFAQVARERMNEFMAEAIANAKNPAEAERLGAMNTQMNHLTNLFQEMQQLETEEEREAYREAIGQTRDTIRDLAREQRDSKLRDTAASFGVTDPEEQSRLINRLDRIQNDPVMRSAFMFGGDRGGSGRGRGGGGRGGVGGSRGDSEGGRSGQ